MHLWNFGKISILLACAGSFNVKNDKFHAFFWLSWLQMLNLPASLQNKNPRIGPFPWKRSVLQNPDRERTNQSTGICLGLGLPYNKYILSELQYFSMTFLMNGTGQDIEMSWKQRLQYSIILSELFFNDILNDWYRAKHWNKLTT